MATTWLGMHESRNVGMLERSQRDTFQRVERIGCVQLLDIGRCPACGCFGTIHATGCFECECVARLLPWK